MRERSHRKSEHNSASQTFKTDTQNMARLSVIFWILKSLSQKEDIESVEKGLRLLIRETIRSCELDFEVLDPGLIKREKTERARAYRSQSDTCGRRRTYLCC